MANWYNDQLTNRNFLSPIGFLFVLDKAKKVSFLCQKADIPTMTLGEVNIPTRGLVPIPVEGNMRYSELTIDFLVDENLENYMEIHNWIYGIGYPKSVQQFKDFVDDRGDVDNMKQFSDGTLAILNSNYNPTIYVRFTDMFPISLSALEFTASENDYTYFTATVTFKYLLYEIFDTQFNLL